MQLPHARWQASGENTFSLDVHVNGRVQGIGLRYFSYEMARRLNLVGYVKNLRDGAVHAHAEGGREALEQFLAALRRGPAGARVREERPAWGVATGQYSGFSIEPTV